MKILSSAVFAAFVVLSAGNAFAMNCPPDDWRVEGAKFQAAEAAKASAVPDKPIKASPKGSTPRRKAIDSAG